MWIFQLRNETGLVFMKIRLHITFNLQINMRTFTLMTTALVSSNLVQSLPRCWLSSTRNRLSEAIVGNHLTQSELMIISYLFTKQSGENNIHVFPFRVVTLHFQLS